MVDEKKQRFSIYFTAQRVSLSLITHVSSNKSEGEPISTCGAFGLHQAGRIKLESLQEVVAVEVIIKSWFDLWMYVRKYAFKLQLVTPLWADGVWHLPEHQKTDISTAKIFQLQLQMMSVDRLHCGCMCEWVTWRRRCTAVCVGVSSNMFHHVTFHLVPIFGLKCRF